MALSIVATPFSDGRGHTCSRSIIMGTTPHDRDGMRQYVVMVPLDLADYIDGSAAASRGAFSRSAVVRVLLREAADARGLQPVAPPMLGGPKNKFRRRRDT